MSRLLSVLVLFLAALASLASSACGAAPSVPACVDAPSAQACVGDPPSGPSRVVAAEGYELSFPSSVGTRRGRDGPTAFRIDFARSPDGARFEAAWFGFPEALDPAEQAILLGRIERGLEVGAEVVSRRESPFAGRAALDLVLDHRDGRRGFHRLLYLSSRAMIQVSAVGPRGGAWERAVPQFWSSLEMPAPPTLEN